MRYSIKAVIDTLIAAGFGCVERSSREDGVTTHVIGVGKYRAAEFSLTSGCLVNMKSCELINSSAHPVQMVKWLRGGKC